MRDSANDAFFTAESLENLSEALVREGIQNSLDAARRENSRVRKVTVRISFVSNAADQARKFLSTHFLLARQNFERGLGQPDLHTLFQNDCGYLVFEDFGTKGLAGDINEWRVESTETNAFFSFFRAEGRSSKSGESLGRWGIGKQVFPTASRLHAIFGLTVRNEEPARVLMGSAVLRTHTVGEQDYQPDAWFGCRESQELQVGAVTDAQFIDSFVETFGLKRKNETGLSIVVPSVDERVNASDLRKGILRSFFWSILYGELVVELETSEGSWLLDAETLVTHRTLLSAPEAAVIEFANWASTAKPAELITLPIEAATRPDWKTIGDDLLPPDKLDEIRLRLEATHQIGIKVPVRVRPKGGDKPETMSHFIVYFASCRDTGNRTIFLRDGIVITDVRCPTISGSRSLVVVDDPALAGLLGDAEGVNHTQWQKDSPKFHNRYFYGGDTIKFVTRSVYEIMQRLHATETKGDPSLLLDIFFLPKEEGPVEPTKKPKVGKNDPVIKPVPPLPPPHPRYWSLEKVKGSGGFMIKPGDTQFDSLPVQLRVQAGYDVRRGKALKCWASDDFNFIRPPLRQIEARGLTVIRAEGNTMEVEIRKADFQFEMSGFDTKRDLVLRVTEMKKEDETDI